MRSYIHSFLFLLAFVYTANADNLQEVIRKMNSPDSLGEARQLAADLYQKAEIPLEKDKAAYWLAECDYRQGNVQPALSVFEGLSLRAANDEMRVQALLRLAMLQMEQNMGDAGLTSYEALARRFPDSKHAPMALMVQGNYLLLMRGEKARSIAIYEQLASKYPDTKEGKLALTALPNLRKLSHAEIRESSRKYIENLKKEQKKAQRKKTK